MGRIITPKYVMEMKCFNYGITPSAHCGRVPSAAKLERDVMAYVISTMPGFTNEHIGYKYGISVPSYACIRENRPGGCVMVEYKAPMFQLLPDPKDYPEVGTMEAFWVDQKAYLERTGQAETWHALLRVTDRMGEAIKDLGIIYVSTKIILDTGVVLIYY